MFIEAIIVNRCIATVLIALILFSFVRLGPSRVCADDEALAELLGKNADYAKQWNEGFIDLRMEGLGGRLTEVAAYWVGDRSRRIMKDFGMDGNREPQLQEIVFNRQTYCRFSPESLNVECGRRIGYPELQSFYRVLPTETWNNVGAGHSVQEWLRYELPEPKVRQVVRTSDGYDVFVGKKEHVTKCISGIVEESALPQIPAGEHVTKVHFNRHGLLESNQYFGALPVNSFLINHEWTDDAVPMPKLYSVQSRKLPEKEYKVTLRMTVTKAGNRLPKDAPSLAVPPTDLPFGSRVSNKIGANPVVFYVGGDAGKAHFEIARAGRRLKEVLSE